MGGNGHLSGPAVEEKPKASKRKGFRRKIHQARRRYRKRRKKRQDEAVRFDELRTFSRTQHRQKPFLNRLGLDRWYRNEILTLPLRNKKFVRKYNPKEIIDTITKIHIKQRLESNNIPIPETYFIAHTKKDLDSLRFYLETGGVDSFVIKPDNTYGGKGILLIKKRERDYFVTVGGRHLELEQVLKHVRRILAGKFSRGKTDVAILEQRVISHRFLEDIVHQGLSDVRVIVLSGYPVMAMARLPTRRSNWKANLHAGAVGAGINLTSGKIVHAIYNNAPVEFHPDSEKHLIGFSFPYWKDILEISSRAQLCSGLGYVGVDIVIDEECGPLVLEVNKRPGLDIQKANNDGLLKRLRWVERNCQKKYLDETCKYYTETPSQKVYKAQLWDQNKWKGPKEALIDQDA